MKNKFKFGLIILLNLVGLLHAEIVEIVSNMYTEEILREECFKKVRADYELRITDQKYKLPISQNHALIKRFVIFNGHDNLADLDACPAKKKVLFMMEPARIHPKDAQGFSRVYTWDDNAIDNKKFFKFYFPDLMPMVNPAPFKQKKLATMIVRNWHAAHRGEIIKFFATKPKGELEFYGSPYPVLSYNKNYKGRIPGLNCGDEKIGVLKTYRFCFCFENITTLNGYISEKIFPCFAAGCVPIYWGAPNIEDYIPKNCFIDYRDFKNNEELYQFIKAMPEEIYEGYLANIRAFLSSEEAKVFSPEYFANTLYEAASY